MASYFGGQGYQANYQANMQQPQFDGVMAVFVSSDASAATYPVAAGRTVALIDIEHGNMWFKSTDMNGMPCPIRTFEIKEVTPQPQNQGNMVTRQEFDALNAKIQQLLSALKNPSADKEAAK